MRSQVRAWLALAVSTGVAYGCGCTGTTVQDAKAHADVVFRGTITALRPSGKALSFSPGFVLDTKKIAVFRVDRVWKGEVGETFEMPAIEEESACTGFWPSFLKVGNDLLVYAQGGGGLYFTSICTRTQLAKNANDFAELGPGEGPKRSKHQKTK